MAGPRLNVAGIALIFILTFVVLMPVLQALR